jgi:bromodomain-containing factor 1
VPFLRPVDPQALNIPHYPTIIKTPMDFSTIERKLNSSNPTKPDPNPDNPRYSNADEFIADVRLIFSNCVTFNGPDHAVTAMGRRVEEVFDKQVKHMPAPLEVSLSPSRVAPVTTFPAAQSARRQKAFYPTATASSRQESATTTTSIYISACNKTIGDGDCWSS